MSAPQSFCEESRLVLETFGRLYAGDMIGSGAYRRVYEHALDDECVIKVEYRGTEFCNVAEMRVWQEVKDTSIEDWFAPCIMIDSLGLVLVQRRTLPFRNQVEFDTELMAGRNGKVPDFFDDVHYGNFGMLDGRMVCHDYGFTHFVRDAVKHHHSIAEKGKSHWQRIKEAVLG